MIWVCPFQSCVGGLAFRGTLLAGGSWRIRLPGLLRWLCGLRCWGVRLGCGKSQSERTRCLHRMVGKAGTPLPTRAAVPKECEARSGRRAGGWGAVPAAARSAWGRAACCAGVCVAAPRWGGFGRGAWGWPRGGFRWRVRLAVLAGSAGGRRSAEQGFVVSVPPAGRFCLVRRACPGAWLGWFGAGRRQERRSRPAGLSRWASAIAMCPVAVYAWPWVGVWELSSPSRGLAPGRAGRARAVRCERRPSAACAKRRRRGRGPRAAAEGRP
ncbi:hypothetical protein ABIA35_008194 [Catenulispora sp. MAP12-49]